MHEFSGPAALAEALASTVAGVLSEDIAGRGAATLAVSGGTTPVRFFQALAHKILDWAAVTVTLVDERCVAADAARSNQRLVREHLLQDAARFARFLPLGPATPVADLLPFTAVILGMGLDGHTASLFPGGEHLAAALAGPHLVQMITAPNLPEPRITLTLPALLSAKFLALHVEGAEKRAALHAAMRPGTLEAMPVRGVLARAPEIFWCPDDTRPRP